jgi:probable F420-dependent oxidoreductase
MQIGGLVRLGALEAGAQPPRFHSINAMASRMEDAGLDSIWVCDHLLYRWPDKPTEGLWECWTVLSALAQVTRRVRLGTLVLAAPFRNPAVLAKMATTLDEISDGRLILGLGAGWHQPEFDAFGVPFDHRASRFEDALAIIRPLLRDGRVDSHGAYYSVADAELLPRGPQPNGPPLMLAGKGPRMLRLVARYADSYNTAWHARPADAVARIDSVRAACTAEGRDPASLEITVGMPLAYPELGSGGMANALRGSPEQIADALRGFANLGVEHVIVDIAPHTSEALDRFVQSVQLFRDG